MSEPGEREYVLPRRDWILLPLVVLAVTVSMLGAAEVTANFLFPERGDMSCEAPDLPGQPHHKPNCASYYKSAEGPMVEYRYNGCGYRSTKPCGPKPPGALRIALIGTSVVMGLHVSNEETFASRIETALNRICSKPVEVQNLGALVTLESQPQLAAEARGLNPDVVVLTVMPYDIHEAPADPGTEQKASSRFPTTVGEIKAEWTQFKLKMREDKAVFAAVHFMLSDEQVLYQNYLSTGDSREVMSFSESETGKRRYARFAAVLDRVMDQLKGSGVPLLVMAVPNRIGAAMVSNRANVEGTDPYWFGRHISEIAVQHGALQLDVTSAFSKITHAERLFYPVDNHPTGGAHAIIAQALVERLTDGSIPSLSACQVSHPGTL